MPPTNTNSVLVSNGDAAVIFDPWGRADDWDALLRRRGLKLSAIYATHGHPDHICAAPELAARHGVNWYMHSADNGLIGWGNDLLAYFGLAPMGADGVAPTDLMCGAREILPTINAQVLSCPGHTPGGVAYLFPDENILLVGDTIFADGVGRCDLPGGDARTLRASIAGLCALNLPHDMHVVPGHGPITTIGELRQHNPYFA